MTDRRQRENLVKDIIVPVCVAVLTGLGASFIGVKIALATLEVQVEYLKNDVDDLNQLMQIARSNQLELGRQAVWAESVEFRLKSLETRPNNRTDAR